MAIYDGARRRGSKQEGVERRIAVDIGYHAPMELSWPHLPYGIFAESFGVVEERRGTRRTHFWVNRASEELRMARTWTLVGCCSVEKRGTHR